MPAFPREELEDVMKKWIDVNQEAERIGDWRILAPFYTDDATYGWNVGPKEDVMCVGIDEIRDIAMGKEMEGLEGWKYPYERVLIDEKIGEIVGFWKHLSCDVDGNEELIHGIGGSWFRYAGDGKFDWQRDFFDFGHIAGRYQKLIRAGKMTESMLKRLKNAREIAAAGEHMQCWYPIGQTPVPLW